jgi:hypothetical protein
MAYADDLPEEARHLAGRGKTLNGSLFQMLWFGAASTGRSFEFPARVRGTITGLLPEGRSL